MMRRYLLFVFVGFAFFSPGSVQAIAAGERASPEAARPLDYQAFVSGAEAQRGLFTIWHKDGKVYLELLPAQLDRDFVETIVPGNGIGGQFIVWGNTDHLPTELVRFERAGNAIAVIWTNPYAVARPGSAAARAIERSLARSVAGVAPIAAIDNKTGAIVFDASTFLDDQLNLKGIFRQFLGAPEKSQPYTLDKERSYFDQTKAFPKNIVIAVNQTWTSEDQRISDVVPDPRNVQMRIVYNIAEPLSDADYLPRLADDRVGIYDDVYLQFDNDRVLDRKLRYIVRWNFQPSDPSKRISPAKHPLIFYLSNTIPQAHRPAIRAGVLAWNAAFERIGISDAIQVRDQPDDPSWDADDVRYNVIRWVTEFQPSFGADSQTLYDPRTGQEFRTGILVSADIPRFTLREWKYFVDPARFGRSTDPMPASFLDDSWRGVILHETGHNLGLQHNFISSMAYTARQLQDKAFTSKFGIAASVMEYAPTNLWPRAYSQGDYYQTVLGPYDYYIVHWGYARIPGAKTPEDELPTLRRWASAWSDPKYRYASDEDASWENGHAADPRANQGDLTDNPLSWCEVRMRMVDDLMAKLNLRFPQPGEAYEAETQVFGRLLGESANCARIASHFIGGQYLSRAHRGDPRAEAPIVPVSRSEQWRAFRLLDRYVFSPSAWHFPPTLLGKLGYSEWSGYGYVGFTGYGNLPEWAYDPPARHDVPLADEVAQIQDRLIRQMFQPLVLARIADAAGETIRRPSMTLGDLFSWMYASVFAELRSSKLRTIPMLRRNLQQRYARMLIKLALAPVAGTPEDATSLARSDVRIIARESAAALQSAALDAATRAHLGNLNARVRQALESRVMMPLGGGGQ